MKQSPSVAAFYKSFGKLVQLHRERLQDMTQEKLGQIIGLSRTSITNIEKGRQHIPLHHLYSIADALRVHPDVLLPASSKQVATSQTRVKLTAADKDLSGWVEKVVTAQN